MMIQPARSGCERLKILFHYRIASKSGQWVHISELMEAFRSLGHELIPVGSGMEAKSFSRGNRLIALLKRHAPTAVYELLEFAHSILDYWRLRRAYLKHRPDLLYERFNLFTLAGTWLRRRYRVPFFLEVNSPLFEERAKYEKVALPWLVRYTQTAAWRGADRVLPVSHVLAGHLEHAGVARDRISVVPNGINEAHFLRDLDAEEAKKALQLSDKFVVGFTGFVHAWHGLDLVIKAIAAMKQRDIVFLVVGDGPPKADLQELAAELGIPEQVRFTGFIDRDAVPGYVAAFDVAVQAAVTPYASPLKMIEYMAVGRAILAPRCANIEELVTHGQTALLFDLGSGESLGTQLARLYYDPALRRALAGAVREQVISREMTWLGNAKRIVQMHRELCSGTRPALEQPEIERQQHGGREPVQIHRQA